MHESVCVGYGIENISAFVANHDCAAVLVAARDSCSVRLPVAEPTYVVECIAVPLCSRITVACRISTSIGVRLGEQCAVLLRIVVRVRVAVCDRSLFAL